MTAELRRGLLLAGIGVIGGFAIIVALYGPGEFIKKARSVAQTAQAPLTLAEKPGEPPAGETRGGAPKDDRQANVAPGGGQDKPAPPASGEVESAPKTDAPAQEAEAPSLDIIRVEPNGESVIAGRSAPNASVEILRDNQPIAKVTADPAGQFAITPPALPTGNSEITFRSVAPDGKETKAKESVVVVVAQNRTSKPLVAVSTPDKPTQVLSQPEATAEAKAPPAAADGTGMAERRSAPADKGTAAEKPAQAEKPPQQVATLPDRTAKPPAGENAPVRIVSVDAQEGGRLDISGRGTAWATLRLYLNDTLVASGQAGPDGKIAFTIGKGVRAGGYQIRVDQVDARSGKVEHRAQVAFAVPESAASKLAANPPATTQRPAQAQPKPPGSKQAETAAPPAPIPAKPDAGQKGAGQLAAGAPTPRDGAIPDLAAKSPAMPPPAPAAEDRAGLPRPADNTEAEPGIAAATPPRTSPERQAAKPDISETSPERQAARAAAEGLSTKLPSMAQAPLPPRSGGDASEGGKAGVVKAPSPVAVLPETSQRPAPETPAMAIAGAGKAGVEQPTPESAARTAQALAPKLPAAAASASGDAPAGLSSGSPASLAEAGTPPRALNPTKPTILPPPATERLADTPTPGAAATAAGPGEPGQAPADEPSRPGSVFVPEINTAKITRGDNLWQISRKSYGSGFRYTVIFDANREQIKDPDLIYPGQIFVLPKDEIGAKRG